MGFFHEMSCFCPFSKFVKGDFDIVGGESSSGVKLSNLFIFIDHLINYSNETVRGSWNSVVAFMEDKTCGCREGVNLLIGALLL